MDNKLKVDKSNTNKVTDIIDYLKIATKNNSIVSRSPLGIKIISRISDDGTCELTDYHTSKVDYLNISEVKPCLRTISSMTKREFLWFINYWLSSKTNLELNKIKTDHRNKRYIIYVKNPSTGVVTTYGVLGPRDIIGMGDQAIEWLCKAGFDVLGLIKKRKALNYYKFDASI